MAQGRFELPTSRLSVERSNQAKPPGHIMKLNRISLKKFLENTKIKKKRELKHIPDFYLIIF